jgi:hypothetical protein
VRRQKSQLLFNFLPEDTFNHARNGTIGKVKWIYEDRKSKVKDLPKGYLLRRIRPYIEQWPNDVPLRPDTVELVAPDGASFEIFPRVFECRRCGACTAFSEDDIESAYSTQCGNCGKDFTDTEQLQFVTVCACGALESIDVPRCSCGHRYTRFRRPTSRMTGAYWECPDCEQRIGDAYTALDDCRFCGRRQSIKVHSSSTTFYPQNASFVNVEDEDLNAIARSSAFQKETIVDYLFDEDTATEPDETELDVDQEVLDALGISEEEYREKKEQVDEQRQERRDEAKQWVTETFGDGPQRREVSEEVFEYQSLVQSGNVDETSLEQLQRDAKERKDLDPAVVEQYVETKEDLNFDSVSLITDFPITTVMYGYSRLDPGPNEESRLNTFPGRDGKDRMFAQTAEAEAVMFTLDPATVYEWLQKNGVVTEWPEEDLDRWFLANLQPFPYYEEIDPVDDSLIARYTLSLLHTMSHTVMTAVDALSGYSLSFVVYKRSDTDFSLGAMHTLIEDRFIQLADYIQDDADVCIYDPVCEDEENAACEDCLFISNISCDNGNHNLSRSTLYGGKFDDEENTYGYLDIEVDEEDV